VRRVIVGFEADDAGDWVARLDCHHRQHIRHRPPIWSAPWIEDDVARARHVGAALACPLCDRCELPDGLVVVRTTATWNERTIVNLSAMAACRGNSSLIKVPGTFV